MAIRSRFEATSGIQRATLHEASCLRPEGFACCGLASYCSNLQNSGSCSIIHHPRKSEQLGLALLRSEYEWQDVVQNQRLSRKTQKHKPRIVISDLRVENTDLQESLWAWHAKQACCKHQTQKRTPVNKEEVGDRL